MISNDSPPWLGRLEELLLESRTRMLLLPERNELNDILRSQAEARSHAAQFLLFDAMLAEGLREAQVGSLVREEIQGLAGIVNSRAGLSTRRLWSHWRPMAAAALVLFSAVMLWQFTRPQVEVMRGVGQQFAGAALPEGELLGQAAELQAGLIELRFRKADASVVIEAPAKFRIVDAKTLRVESGRISAHVRDGKEGLKVLTPETEVLDLGTRFAVDVRAGGRSEVHVFDGKVAVGGVRKELVTTNQALTLAANVAAESRELRSGAFVQPEEMKPLANALAAGRVQQWRQARSVLEKDPALLAWMDFDFDAAGPSRGERLEIHGAHAVQGRFPGEGALEFVDREDYARLNVKARVRQLTLMTWVRLDAVTAERSGLLMVDAAAGDGAVRWLVKPKGRLRFWLQGMPPAESPAERQWPKSAVSVFGDLGGWRHLAVTYDADARLVRFFIDGQLDSEARTTAGLDAVLGPAIVGNVIKNTTPDAIPQQRLSGRMDELIMFQRTLSPAEIQQHFAAGNPYR